MLNSLSSFNNINKYKSNVAQSATIIGTASNNLNGQVKFANFTTSSATNLYGSTPASGTVTSLSVQNTYLPNIASQAQITNTITCNSATRGKVTTGSFAFNSANGLTICCWLYPFGAYNGSDMKVFEGDQSESMLLWQGSGSFNFNFNNLTPIFSLPQSVWSHVACVMDRANAKQYVYVNSVLVGSSTGVTGFPTSTSAISANGLSIGCSLQSGHKPFTGYLTDYRLYPRQLSAIEVKSIHQGYT